jgi:hypothetical protein
METNDVSQKGKLVVFTVATTLAFLLWIGTELQSQGAGGWTNEPSGLSAVLDCPFSGQLCPGMFNAYGNQPLTGVSLNGQQPPSPTGVLDYFLPAGATSGGGQFGYSFQHNLGRKVREVYLGTWWATNADFVGNRNNSNKLLFISGDGNNNVLIWSGAPFEPKQILWVNQSVNNNCHVSGWVGSCGDGASQASGYFKPNASYNGVFAAGSGWHRIEIYQKASTTASSRDGIIRIWLDGILHTNYSNLNLSEGGFHSVQYNSTWQHACDGTTVPGFPLSWYRDCSKEWHHYYDHLRVSVGEGSSASSIDRPLGPPAAPKIESVTVTVIP